jgi:hypothetical protein
MIDSNMYMVLGTADGSGRPWVSPLYFSADGYTEFFWVSSPEATHSRNLALRPQVSVVIFDPQVPIGTGQCVYMAAFAEEVSEGEVDRGIDIFSRMSLCTGGGHGPGRTCSRRRPTGCTERSPRNTGLSIPRAIRTDARA